MGGEAVALLLGLLPVLTLTQLGTNASLWKGFKCTTNSLYLKGLKLRLCYFMIFFKLYLFYRIRCCAKTCKILVSFSVRFDKRFISLHFYCILRYVLFRFLLSRSGCTLATGTMWAISKRYHNPRLLQIT